jgi:hypothetical protein
MQIWSPILRSQLYLNMAMLFRSKLKESAIVAAGWRKANARVRVCNATLAKG